MCRERRPDEFRPLRMGLVRAAVEDALREGSVRKKADDEMELRKRKSGDIAGAKDWDEADESFGKMKRFRRNWKSDRPTYTPKLARIPPARGEPKKSATESSAEWSLREDSGHGSTRAPSFSVSTGRLSKSSSVSESEVQGGNWKESYSSADDDSEWTKGTAAVALTNYSRKPWPSEEGRAAQLGGGFLSETRSRRGAGSAVSSATGFPSGVKGAAAAEVSGGRGKKQTDSGGNNFGLFKRVVIDGSPCLFNRVTHDSRARGSAKGSAKAVDHSDDSGGRGSAQAVDRSDYKERRECGVPTDNVQQVRRRHGRSDESRDDGRVESLANRSQSDESGEVRGNLLPVNSRRQKDGSWLGWKEVQVSTTTSAGGITDGRSDEQRTTDESEREEGREYPGGGRGGGDRWVQAGDQAGRQLFWGLSAVKRGRSESADCASCGVQESRSDSRGNEATSVAKDEKRHRDGRALGPWGREEEAQFSFRGLLSSEDKGNGLPVESTITGEGGEKSGEGGGGNIILERTGAVQFVLSSGRKTAYGDREADGDARMGKKELTIDEEFELHFSQMFI